MQVLAGIQLIFFRVASMVLSFGFVLDTVLVIRGGSLYCWAVFTQCQGLFSFGVTTFVFPSNRYTRWNPAVLEMGEHLPADGK